MDVTLVLGDNSRIFHHDTMMGTLSKRCEGQTEGQTENTIHTAAWSQLKTLLTNMKFFASFHGHMLIETGLTVPKRVNGVMTST